MAAWGVHLLLFHKFYLSSYLCKNADGNGGTEVLIVGRNYAYGTRHGAHLEGRLHSKSLSRTGADTEGGHTGQGTWTTIIHKPSTFPSPYTVPHYSTGTIENSPNSSQHLCSNYQ